MALGVLVRETGVVHAHLHRHVLQLAGAIGHAEGAHMIALCEEQLHRHAPVALQLRCVGMYLHPFSHGGDAGRFEFGVAFKGH